MPTFGDFETIGEPVSVAELSGHVSTVWRARKVGSDSDATHAIKCFAPHRRKTGEGETEDALDKDRGLEFLEGVKQLKKAEADGGRCLCPIHAFGFADEGAWYVTDFYPRGTLKAWIARRGSVDNAALRQVVSSIVTGCLALKRARGYSHGNLKAANVFLVGKPQPLRKTPLALADAYPSAPLQLARLVGEEKRTVDELLHQVMEVQDLRALGELLLQLVEGRLVSSAYDYNYPIAASPAWERLGRDADRWRDLTNQLLDPRLSLEKLSLESLAAEYKPGVAAQKLPLILGAAAGVVVLLGCIFLVASMVSKSGNKNFQAHLQSATNAFAGGDWPLAQREIELALERRGDDPAALEWKTKINTRLDEDFTAALASGRQALRVTNLDEATRWSERATDLKPQAQDALELQGQIATVRKQIELAAKYDAAMKLGQAAYSRNEFKVAFDKAEEALSYKPGDATATKLKNDADGRLRSITERETKYATALQLGQAAYSRSEFKVAFDKAEEALSYKPGDATATKLKNDADGMLKSAAERQVKYDAALRLGQAAFNRNEFKVAYDKAEEALSYKPGDATATKLKNDADGQMKTAAEREAKYDGAIKLGQAAYSRSEFKVAFDKAEEALSYKPGDATATKLKNDADGQLKSAAEREAKYDAAMRLGQAAYSRNEFKVAYDKAAEALSHKPGDAIATKLKNDADGQLKSAAEREAKYDAALKLGQSAYSRNEFKVAFDKAEEALSYKPGDATATKLKNDADGMLKSAVEREAKYEAALKAAQAAYDRNEFKLAYDQAEEALKQKPGDTAATKLRDDAARQQLLVSRQQTYQAAMTAAQQALAEAEAALSSTNYNQVDEKLKLALAQAAVARTNGEAAPVNKLEQDVKALQAKAITARQEGDYVSATGLMQAGKLVEAQAVCQTHRGVSRFDALGQSLGAMQTAHQAGTASLARGEYAFVQTIESSGYDKNPFFSSLMATAREESKQLSAMEQLRNQNQWQALKDGLARLSPPLLQKSSFAALSKWVDDNSPLKNLDRRLEVFKVWYGIKGESAAVVDWLTGQPAKQMPKAPVADYYYEQLNNLSAEYEKLGVLPQRERDLKQLRDRMNLWF